VVGIIGLASVAHGNFVAFSIQGGYCVWAYVVLLKARYAAEFE
jgi:hypothetical protein